MSSRRTSSPSPARLGRRHVRLAVTAAVMCGVGALAVVTLLEERDDPRPPAAARRPASEPAAVAPTTTTAASPSIPALAPPRRPAPSTLAATLAADRATTGADLAAWLADRELAPEVRYAALRRLEQESPADAVSAAVGVLDDLTPLVRLNAIAVLTRSSDPRARAALERLDARSLRLAEALARRG